MKQTLTFLGKVSKPRFRIKQKSACQDHLYLSRHLCRTT